MGYNYKVGPRLLESCLLEPYGRGHEFTQLRAHLKAQLCRRSKNCYFSIEAMGFEEVLSIDHPEGQTLILARQDAGLHLVQVHLFVVVGIEDFEVGMGLVGNELGAKVKGIV